MKRFIGFFLFIGGTFGTEIFSKYPFSLMVFPSPIDWEEGRKICREKGMKIASIHSRKENEIVVSLLKKVKWRKGGMERSMDGFYRLGKRRNLEMGR